MEVTVKTHAPIRSSYNFFLALLPPLYRICPVFLTIMHRFFSFMPSIPFALQLACGVASFFFPLLRSVVMSSSLLFAFPNYHVHDFLFYLLVLAHSFPRLSIKAFPSTFLGSFLNITCSLFRIVTPLIPSRFVALRLSLGDRRCYIFFFDIEFF